MKVNNIIKQIIVCLFCGVCIMFIGCAEQKNLENYKIGGEIKKPLLEYYQRYIDATEMFDQLEAMNLLERWDTEQKIVESLNSEEAIKNQEELKSVIDKFKKDAEENFDGGFANMLDSALTTIIQIKDGICKIEFEDACNDILKLREQAKLSLEANK